MFRKLTKRSYWHLLFLFLVVSGFYSGASFARTIDVYDVNDNHLGEIDGVKSGRYYYISLESFAKTLNLPYFISKSQKAFVFDFPRSPIVLAAFNPYIIVGEEIRQMPLPVIYQNRKYYAPAEFFLEAVGNQLPLKADLKDDRLIIAFGGENIASVSIEEKINGLVITIATTEPIPSSDIFTSQTNNWLYVDIYGGRLDTLRSLPVVNSGQKIREVATHQLSEETARLGFKTFVNIIKVDILESGNPDEIVIALRTQEKIADDILAELEKERQKWIIDTIVLDPGHGGKDPGAIGRSGLYEKKVTLEIAKEIKREIERRLDVKVVMTRTGDEFVPLKKRTEIANKAGGKLFISIHVDSNPVSRLSGHTVYFLGPAKTEEARQVAQFENSVIKFEESQNHYAEISETSFILAANAQNAYNRESEEFAEILDRELAKETGRRGFGVKQGVFYVLYGASMPNILLETAFISNRSDERRLNNRSFHKDIASALCNSIIELKRRYDTN